MDEDNYKEAIDASFKVFAPRGISKFILAEACVKFFGGFKYFHRNFFVSSGNRMKNLIGLLKDP